MADPRDTAREAFAEEVTGIRGALDAFVDAANRQADTMYDAGWSNAIHAAKTEPWKWLADDDESGADTDDSGGTDAPETVPATPIDRTPGPTETELIADGRVVTGQQWMREPGVFRNTVIHVGDGRNGLDIIGPPGEYLVENVFVIGNADTQGGIATPAAVDRKITLRNVGVRDIESPTNLKGVGIYLDGAEIDIDGAVGSNIAWRENQATPDQTQFIYAKGCRGTISNVLADRIQFAAIKRSTNGDQPSSVSVSNVFAYRCGCITNLSTSSFADVRQHTISIEICEDRAQPRDAL